MIAHLFSILTLLSTFRGLQAEPMETALLVNNKPLDLEWQSCLNTVACIKTNVIERVADLETKVPGISFGNVPQARGLQINLGSRLKMKVIRKDDGHLALRFLANDNPMDQTRGHGHFAEKKKLALIGFSMLLFVLGVVSTTLKVNVFLALLGVAIGKILLLYVYTEHLLHHKHHPGVHIHKAPVHHYRYSPVHIEPVPIIEQEVHHDVHHEPYHHDHYGHDDWIFGRKKRAMQL